MRLSLRLLSFAEIRTRFEVTLSDAETKLGYWLGMSTHGRDARHLWRLHLGCGFAGLPPEPVLVTRQEDLHRGKVGALKGQSDACLDSDETGARKHGQVAKVSEGSFAATQGTEKGEGCSAMNCWTCQGTRSRPGTCWWR